jgi:glycosyltransferase involved in cell wall biosynthesis
VSISGLARFGGPARAVPALGAALAERGVDVQLVLPEPPGNDVRVPIPDTIRVTRVTGRFDAEGVPITLPGLQAAIEELLVPGTTVLHDHGFWRPTGRACARVARARHVPLVLSPRGMLTRESLAQRRWRKTVALLLWGRRDAQSASVLHCTSADEATDLQSLRLGVPLAVIPTGIAMPPAAATHADDAPLRTCVFVGRLAPIKGLDTWLRAWAQVRPTGWRLVLVGPDERGEQARLAQLAGALGIADSLTFAGPADDAAKWQWLASADLAVLPSIRESFGLAAGEALAAGVPVIATTGVPWPELDTHACGWRVPPSELADALADATQRTAADRRAMGQRGRAVIAAEYAWPAVATAMHAVYDWVLGRAPRPPAIVAP